MMFLRLFQGPELSRIARRYAWTVPLVALFGIINGLFEGLGISLLIPMLGGLLNDRGLALDGPFGVLARFGDQLAPRERLLAIATLMLALMVMKGALQALTRIFIVSVDGRAGDDIRRALATRLICNDYAFHLAHDQTRLVSIISTESWHASEAVRAAFTRVASMAAGVPFIVLLLIVNWWLTAIVIAGALAIRLLRTRFDRALQGLSRQIAQANRDAAERMLASVYHARLIRLFRREAIEQRLFYSASDKVRVSMFGVERLASVIAPMLEVLHIALFLAVLIVAVLYDVSLPVLAAFLVLLNRLQPHLRAVEASSITLASASTQVAEVEWLLATRPAEMTPAPARQVSELREGIAFYGVTFAYPARPDVLALDAASFTISAGKTTAIVGRSGAGKSTLINLICGLVQPSAGTITVDGIDLTGIERDSWLNCIGVAGQDVDLVDGTIAENIAFGTEAYADADIEEAARRADAHDFIAWLPAGYTTQVGNRGYALSGGQRQRIGIARALIRNPKLLILDEATNAVDGLSEAAILSLLNTVKGQTIIIISHRPSTLALCDHTVTIDAGKVVEAESLGALAVR